MWKNWAEEGLKWKLYGCYIYLVAIDSLQHEKWKQLFLSSPQTISTHQRRNHIQRE